MKAEPQQQMTLVEQLKINAVMIIWHFNGLQRYCVEIKDIFNHYKAAIDEAANTHIKHSPQDAEKVVKAIEMERIKYDELYTELFFNSTFISCYSTFESTFGKLCNNGADLKQTKLKPKDIVGDGIEKYRNFMIKVVGLDLESINHIWNDLKKYQKIRNIIAHQSANIFQQPEKKLEAQELYPLVSKSPYLKFVPEVPGQFYICDHTFIREFLDQGSKYLRIINELMLQIAKDEEALANSLTMPPASVGDSTDA